jgi:hypothetical protein
MILKDGNSLTSLFNAARTMSASSSSHSSRAPINNDGLSSAELDNILQRLYDECLELALRFLGRSIGDVGKIGLRTCH